MRHPKLVPAQKKSKRKRSYGEKTRRPAHSKYRQTYPRQLIEFFSRPGERVVKPTVVSQGEGAGSEIVDHPIGHLPPFFEDFARKIGVTISALEGWRDRYPKFREAYAEAKRLQKAQLVKGGLAGTYSSTPWVFSMKNMHRWHDKQQHEIEGKVSLEDLVSDSRPVDGADSNANEPEGDE